MDFSQLTIYLCSEFRIFVVPNVNALVILSETKNLIKL